MKIVVLGAGMMGTAFTVPLVDAGHEVSLVGTHLDDGIIEELSETRIHPKLKRKIHDSVALYTVSGLDKALIGADLIVLGVNSHGVAWSAGVLASALSRRIPVVMLTKGLHGDGQSLQILPDYLSSKLPEGLKDVEVMAIGGPCIAADLADRQHSCVVLGGKDEYLLSELARAFRTTYYHVWTTTDLIGLETCVALKNLYALAAGIVIGLTQKEGLASEAQYSAHNPVAAIFAQALYEIAYVVEYLGGDLRSVYTLPGAGDLYVTCQGGRNSKMGRYIGLGMTYKEAKEKYMPEESVEGAMLAEAIGPTVHTLVDSGRLDKKRIPLLLHIVEVVCDGAPVKIPWDFFFKD